MTSKNLSVEKSKDITEQKESPLQLQRNYKLNKGNQLCGRKDKDESGDKLQIRNNKHLPVDRDWAWMILLGKGNSLILYNVFGTNRLFSV